MASSGNRVLVVEDDPASRSFLQIALHKRGYVVVGANDAAEAEEQLTPENIGTFSCVITDYRMPEITGLELLNWIKERDSTLAIILVTAESEKRLITESLRGGALDFLDKPVNPNELHSAVARAVEQTSRQRHMRESESAVKDLVQAQQRMLATDASGGAGRVDLCFYPKHEAGGDFFTSFRPEVGKLFCLLTDVSGHDLSAAYISAYFQGFVRGLLTRGARIEEIFPVFNRFLLEKWNQSRSLNNYNLGFGTSVAACALSIDFDAQSAMVFTQGTPSPVYFAADSRTHVIRENGNFPLGWFSDVASDGVSFSFSTGGSFCLWTDGLEDLAEKLRVSSLSLVSAFFLAKEKKVAPPQLEAAADDILLVLIDVPPSKGVGDRVWPLISERYHGGSAGEIDEFQAFWERSLALAVPELPEAKLHDILLASREALLNALKHGCHGRAEEAARFEVAVSRQDRTISVRVSDPGAGHDFDFAEHEKRSANQLAEEHFGLILIHHLADSVSVDNKGANITMKFNWHEPGKEE